MNIFSKIFLTVALTGSIFLFISSAVYYRMAISEEEKSLQEHFISISSLQNARIEGILKKIWNACS
jgi:hypothetical protein